MEHLLCVQLYYVHYKLSCTVYKAALEIDKLSSLQMGKLKCRALGTYMGSPRGKRCCRLKHRPVQYSLGQSKSEGKEPKAKVHPTGVEGQRRSAQLQSFLLLSTEPHWRQGQRQTEVRERETQSLRRSGYS